MRPGLTARLVAIVAACAAATLLACDREGAGCPPDCNVVLVSIDTLRADHLGLHGYARDTSPNLDRLGREAVVFENAISQSAWTTPAHASMMTGLHPHEHGLVYYSRPGSLPDAIPTLAERLAARGYRTVSFNGGGYVSADFGLAAGFEIYGGTRFFRPNVDAARRWLEDHGSERFFLFLHAYDVHRPYVAPRPFDLFWEGETRFDLHGFCDSGEHAYGSPEELAYIVSQYDAGIRYADFVVGEFLDHLRDSGLLDRSIVVVTSDHGDELFEHGACDHIKSVYRELVHVPLLIRVPGQPPRRIRAQVPASIAVTPTVLELLGVDAGPLAARSLAPLVRGGGGGFAHVASETGKGGGNGTLRYWRGLQSERWKLVHARDGEQERFELYDLVEDPTEQVDVASTRPDVLDRLLPELLRIPVPGPPSADGAPLDPETLESLRALGYAQ